MFLVIAIIIIFWTSYRTYKTFRKDGNDKYFLHQQDVISKYKYSLENLRINY